MFVIDNSGSVGKSNFRKIQKFLIKIIGSWKIGYKKVRVAVVSFSNKAFVNFHLKTYKNKYQLRRAIRMLKYQSGGTNTYKALRLLRTVFRRRNGDRKYAPNIAIVVTDGKSSNSRLTKKAAQRIKRRGVRLFSVAIGHKVRRSELRAMASYPKYKHIFTVGNFNTLKTITRGITRNICQGMCMFIYFHIEIRKFSNSLLVELYFGERIILRK